MADHLTNLQDSLDQLATQMFASLRYISAHHSLAPIANQPFHGESENSQVVVAGNHALDPSADTQNQTQTQTQSQTQTPTQAQPEEEQEPDVDAPPRPDTPRAFAAALEELARDLVTKEQQIEALIGSLPGRGRSWEEQEARLRELDKELREVEGQVAEAKAEREELTHRVEEVMWKVRRW